ncbi:hypothetical protein SHO565_64710 [Streptomyces sp. HO565]
MWASRDGCTPGCGARRSRNAAGRSAATGADGADAGGMTGPSAAPISGRRTHAQPRTVRDMQDASREALTEVLRAAMGRGEIAARHDPHTVAAFLVTFLNGLLVSSKITPDAPALEPLVEVALTALV